MSGELGAGKTALAQGIGRVGAVVCGLLAQRLPDYEYPRLADGRILYHVDCYRLEETADQLTVGLEDVLDGSGTVMIEWPERIEAMLPEDRLWIALSYVSETRRKLHITATAERSAELLDAFKKSAFGI